MQKSFLVSSVAAAMVIGVACGASANPANDTSVVDPSAVDSSAVDTPPLTTPTGDTTAMTGVDVASGPVVTDEVVDVAELQPFEVRGLGGASAIVTVGPRPSGEPGFCAIDAFGSMPGRPQCFAADSEGRLFMPMYSDAANVAIFMHPDVVRATNESGGVLSDVPIVAVAGLDGVFAVVTPDDDQAVSGFSAVDGTDVHVAEYTPLRNRP